MTDDDRRDIRDIPSETLELEGVSTQQRRDSPVMRWVMVTPFWPVRIKAILGNSSYPGVLKIIIHLKQEHGEAVYDCAGSLP